jgi:hypothetical protein
VAAHLRDRAPAAPRLRGPGPGALVGPPRALPAVVRRGQHPGRERDDARAVLPPPAPPGDARIQEAAGRHVPKVAAAPSRRPSPGSRISRAGPSRRSSRTPAAGEGGARDSLLGKGLLRPGATTGRRTGSRTRRSSGSSSSTPSTRSASARSPPGTRGRASSGARRSPRTWEPGPGLPEARGDLQEDPAVRRPRRLRLARGRLPRPSQARTR